MTKPTQVCHICHQTPCTYWLLLLPYLVLLHATKPQHLQRFSGSATIYAARPLKLQRFSRCATFYRNRFGMRISRSRFKKKHSGRSFKATKSISELFHVFPSWPFRRTFLQFLLHKRLDILHAFSCLRENYFEFY